MRIDLKCPVEYRGASIKTSTKTNEDYALLKLFNLSDKVISEVSFTAKFYDTYGKELGEKALLYTDVAAEPKSFIAENKAISLEDYPETKHISVDFNVITFDDGEEYFPSNYAEIEITEAEGDDARILKETAGDDAVCFAKDPGLYWVCVCGRPNENDSSCCVRCNREKDEVMSKFSTSQALMSAYEQKLIENDRAELLKYKAIEQKKIENKKKAKKFTIFGLVGILVAAVLAVIVYYIYVFCAIQMGNVHLKNENYDKAYALYSQVGSSSVAKVSEMVRGNSASNNYASGILAEDDKNYYYLDSALEITIENKENPTPVKTGLYGVSLNAANDHLYFINAKDNYKIYKMNPETKETSPVKGSEDQLAMYLTVIGNDLFYSAIETDANGQQFPVIYKLKEGKKPVVYTDAPSQFFDVYKNKLYYISGDETQSLYCVEKPGDEPKLVLEGPIGQFEIKDDIIYYIDYTIDPNSQDGIPVLSINKADMSGNFLQNLSGDTKAYFFNIAGDRIYFSNYSDSMLIYYIALDSGVITPVSEATYSVMNISGDVAVALTPAGQMEKINLATGEKKSIMTRDPLAQ